MKSIKKIVFILLLCPILLFSRTVIVEGEIDWRENVISKLDANNAKLFLDFEGAKYDHEKDYKPFFSRNMVLNQERIFGVELIDVVYEEVSASSLEGVSGKAFIGEDINLKFVNGISKKINYGSINFTPIIFNSKTAIYQRVVSYKIKVEVRGASFKKAVSNKTTSSSSVLNTGDWYKIAVVRNGVFKLTYQFLKNLGLDIDNLSPNDFKLYGNGGKQLPALNAEYRVDDLKQNAVFVGGDGDAVFTQNDFILFYGQAPHAWIKNDVTNLFEHKLNEFSDTTYYFITCSNTGETAKRIGTQSSHPSPTQTVNTFNDFQYYENDVVNLIKSGAMWFGEYFDATTAYDFVFNFPNIDQSSPVNIVVSAASRSGSNSVFTIASGGDFSNLALSYVNLGSYSGKYAQVGSQLLTANALSDLVNVNVSYNKPASSSVGWLDEIEINARRQLNMVGDQLFFRDVQSVGIGNVSTFSINNGLSVNQVWEITDPFNIKQQNFTLTGSTIAYSLATDSLREFVAFSDNYDTQVFGMGRVENQNLHETGQVDMVIVSHPSFIDQSNAIAQHHIDNDGLDVVVVTPQQIYNEFSSGSQDIIAIRSFMKMLYDRALVPEDLPQYLLLVGDGSFDNKNRIVGNSNFIPTYQTPNSVDVVGSLVSDDYFGLLDANEGTFLEAPGTELLDIAIGRLPVKSTEEANNVLNKIINYNTPSSMKDWRNKITFIGDDEDGNIHMNQSNSLGYSVELGHKDYNVNKIFLDAFKQESTPGGSRYPEVKLAINEAVNSGSLIVNYTGHGGEVGWAEERVLTVGDVNSWNNKTAFPLFITATCEFSRFDDPLRTTAGELVLVGPSGGIALLTTVRLVYSSPNFQLNTSFYNNVFTVDNDKFLTLGEVFMKVKNLNSGNANNRNFTLLGDPALTLAHPIEEVVTTKINDAAVSSNDTIKALSKVTVVGEVRDAQGAKLTNFNGVIYPTVFDKEKQIVTLANDGGSPFNFNLQNSKLFKGKVSVTNGDFSYSFVVPKDISYNYGKGKLSHYAENQVQDANGYHADFYIGGTSDNYEADEVGPEIELFMNDEQFVFGGMTDENPILLANISDIHGINMVGNGIGHDIVAVLDDKTDESFILNDFYEAELNSYQSGKVYFPLSDLEEGRHKLKLKVWDVYNNSSEATIEFVVVKTRDVVIDRVYNYPNPFTTYTEFWFEHNQPGKNLFAQVQVFTVSGKLVKTLEKHVFNEGFRSTSITWNGLDEYGDKIGKGVYVYRLKVRTENYSVAEKYEKLVILR